jgi:predicted TIM-barrel fold metal-dependent hydrolase
LTDLCVIDAHTHIFPPGVAHFRDPYLQRDIWFSELYTHPKARVAGAEELLVSMTEAGVGQSVVCGFPWRDIGLCQEHNDYMADACAASDGRLVWLGIVPPAAGAAAVREAERCFSLGAVGLGELNADAQGFDLIEPLQLREVGELCVERDRPIMFHSSEPVGHQYPGKGRATPEPLLAMITAYPELRCALAHWGGGLPFYELMPEVAAVTRRVVYDSAATTYLYRHQVFRTVIDLVGAARVMFASDFPVLGQRRLLRQVRALPWTDADEERTVLELTARDLYRIPPLPNEGTLS